MSNKNLQVRMQHFAALKSKYQATNYEDSSPSSLLYLILRKADLGVNTTQIELDWLRDRGLIETIKSINNELAHKARETEKIQAEYSNLKSKYKANSHKVLWESSPLYSILWKLDSENELTNSELNVLKELDLNETASLAIKMKDFKKLKIKYEATKSADSIGSGLLYPILKKLEAEEQLKELDISWLKKHNFLETLAIFKEREAVKEAEFAKIKEKYQATKDPDLSVSSPLYKILKNLDADKQLSESELNWLKEHQLNETLGIVLEIEQKRHFAELKVKYKANEYEDSSPSSHLYKVLKKIDLSSQLGEQDINFLRKRNLNETIGIGIDKYVDRLKSKIESGEHLSEADIDWLKQNGREDVITFAQEKEFAALKVKYRIIDRNFPFDPFYTIMVKLEKEERLDPVLVIQLIQEGLLAPHGKIAIAYHRLEARFYEQEYERTGDRWNLPNASSHWRKAEEPQSALKVTENLDFNQIKENKLKSALLTTRGGAFRDIEELDDAEKCARKAIDYQPQSHHPYTLMGAIYYGRGQFLEGDRWFNEAIKRGAKSEDIDDEIKRVVKNAKDENKRREVIEYLLKKDPHRYAWANSYQKKSKDKGK